MQPGGCVNGPGAPGEPSGGWRRTPERATPRITWYVDGVKKSENTNKDAIPTTPMHLAIQLDMGPFEEWILAPDETTPAEVSLEVDWVRVYRPR